MARLLIVEDDRLLRETISHTLEAAGHEVRAAPDGVQALKLYRQRPADLIVTDIIMPNQDGIETIRALRRLDPAVPIIAISGAVAAFDVLGAAAKLGATRTLRKPIRRAALLAAVEDSLKP